MNKTLRGLLVLVGMIAFGAIFCLWLPFILLPGAGIGVALPVIYVPGEILIKDFLGENEERIGRSGKEVQGNITDNDSAKMKTGKGTIQGYTAVAVTDGKHQVIVEAQAHGAPQEQELLQPVLARLERDLKRILRRAGR